MTSASHHDHEALGRDGRPQAAPRDRRYVCQRCDTKWFIPAARSHVADLLECPSCQGPVLALVGER
jgi:DNA-directed RNA polymerase subunit RPC12/RpoP